MTWDVYTLPAGGGQLSVYSTEENNPFCFVNWLEVNGIECYLDSVENDLYNDRADYSYDWGEIIISSATLSVKNNITYRPNLSVKERKIRIGFNCFWYDYRILDIIQRSNESKPWRALQNRVTMKIVYWESHDTESNRTITEDIFASYRISCSNFRHSTDENRRKETR